MNLDDETVVGATAPHISVATWREALAGAQDDVGAAYGRRRQVFQRACREGLTLRQIAEATGLSVGGVHKIVGTRRAGADALDQPMGE